MEDPQPAPKTGPRNPGRLEKEEAWLWRTALLFLVLFATSFAVLAWERLEGLPFHLGAIAIGSLVLAILFAVYVYGRRREVSELKHLLRDLESRSGVAPSDEQLDQLSQVIAKSQKSFKELIDSFDDVAFAASLDGTVRTVNRRVSDLLGISYSNIVGHKIDEFVDEPRRADVETGLARFLDKRRWAGLVTVKPKNNTRTLYFDCVLNAIVKDGEVVGISTLARDVTEEREKEKRFTELFETLQEGVYFSTPEGKFLDANPALVRMLGYANREELLAQEPQSLGFQPDNANLETVPEDAGGVRTRELTLQRKNGTSGIFKDSSRAVWNSEGKVVRYQGTLVDVTERRQMMKALRQQEEFQRYLLESFPDLILVIDVNEQYSFVSARVRDILGYKPEDLLGKKVEDLHDHTPDVVSLYRDILAGHKVFGYCEYGALHRDGNWLTMRASASALFDSEQKVSGVIISVRDITVEKKLEQQIIQSERLAAMGQMIGGFTHELNNPLTSILGVAELLDDNEVSEATQKQFTILKQQARRAADIVKNLMYFSRPPAPGKSSVNISELVQRTLHLQAYALRKSNITVDFLPETSLPPVMGDPHQIMQVFLNLILNAEQAIREARDKGTLRIRLTKDPNSVLATFQDDGPGIPAETLPKIFDPFYTTKRPGRGTGLGLSICKAIMKEHAGNIEASSGPGGGAVFTVTIPIAGKQS